MYRLIVLLFGLSSLLWGNYQERVASAIDGLIESVDPTALVGVKVVSLDNGTVLYQRNQRCRFIPASTIKVLTVGAALSWLGEEDTFATEVFGTGVIEEGVLKGDLYLVGSGDPSLTALDLVELVEKLSLSSIEGEVVIDQTCFEDGSKGPGWMWDEEPAFWCVPMNGLNIDHNFIDEYPLEDPSRCVATLFCHLLLRKGIEVNGVRWGKAPDKKILLASHESAPLLELAKKSMKRSDNLYANCIFKKMGGSWDKGREKVERFLRDVVCINPEELVVVDGSGESRYNLISPDQMIEVLQKLRYNRKFRSTFAVPGEKGTLKERMVHLPGKIYAKSGSMTGVSALCGYITTELGKNYAFVIYANGFVKKVKEIKKELEDQVCQVILTER